MIFRPCLKYSGYSAALDGTIRRDAYDRTTKLGLVIPLEATTIKHVGRNASYVTIKGRFVRWDAMVLDAWTDVEDDRPRSSYPDGRVLTVGEWIEIRRSGCQIPTLAPSSPNTTG